MKMTIRISFFCAIVMLFAACKEEYNVKIPSPGTGYLVVEGFANLTPNSKSTIKLSRTTSLDSSFFYKTESGAIVLLFDDVNGAYNLFETSPGVYTSNAATLDPARKYRLRIVTRDQKEYNSAWVEGKMSPAIDSISWKQKSDGVQIYANTHDSQNKTIYYMWDYRETWQYNTILFSSIVYNPATNALDPRDLVNNDIHTCWISGNSTNIIVTSTERLATDVVFEKPLTFLSYSTNKLQNKYSILVNQYALTKDAYTYLDLMRKNTEQLGSIFDAQPSELNGNIRQSNDSTEIVVGFFYATSVQQQRIFISHNQLNGYVYITTGYESCREDTVDNVPDKIREAFRPGPEVVLGVSPVYFGPAIIAYTYTSNYCADCRARGGSTTKPDFWQ
ncbi:DUF4249 domain-containing protein [Pinibacter aurantiacus]|uniref:DUF4249 domain-containing protein n=1 Tax=Pinibacter aurantiacus TaxID=2851599 RepID=A0A9E2S8R3_9BACT|nr:DUF4249 domain-containing protein [Pinibacter aurantiacus]MBV4356977.1 DUF4249 domain-containing protein [Pinibacter aurantiacus]